MKKFILNWCAAVIAGGGTFQIHAALSWSTSSGVNISDYPATGAASDIYISSGDSQLSGIVNPYVASIASVTFTIVGNPTAWAGDYTLVLQHVADDGLTSQSQTLFSSLLGGAAANNGFDNVTLSSTGSGSISSGASASSTAAITGTYLLNFASTFQDVSPTGDWILFVTDTGPDFQGTLSGWSMSLDVVPEPVNVALGIFGGLLGLAVLRRKLKFGKQKAEMEKMTLSAL